MKKRILSISHTPFKVKGYGMLLASLLLLVSCGQDDDVSGFEQPPELEKIRFEISHASAIASSSANASQTRMSIDEDGNCSWTDGDKVGVFIVEGSSDLKASGNWVDNLEMTFNNNEWDYTMPSGKEYYPIDKALDFYAYYPYQENTNPLVINFSVKADQSSKANFEKSRLLTATKADVYKNANPVELKFSNALAMIELSVTSGGDGAKMTDVINVTIEGCKMSSTFKLNDMETNNEAENDESIKMYRVEQESDENYRTEYTYWALLPAQSAVKDNILFKFAQGDNSLTHKPAEPVAFMSGHLKPYNVTLSVTLETDHLYSLYDPYPYKGLPMGVVFEISNGGKNGKIVSLTENYLAWGPVATTTDAIDENDGQKNMDKVKDLDSDLSEHPAFKWCNDLGSGWYFPAQYEVGNFMEEEKRNELNKKIIANGGFMLGNRAFYGTSTEVKFDYNAFLMIRTANNYPLEYPKTTKTAIRAVRKF